LVGPTSMTSHLDLSSSSRSLATEGPEHPSDASTISQLVFLAFGLLVFSILWAVPVAFLIWVSGSYFGSVGIAEALERTRGLAPTTYGAAFWLSVVATIAMVVLEARAMLRGDPERRSKLVRFITRPSTAFWVLLVPTALLVRLDVRGTDVPDVLTTTLLLCSLGYLWFVLPLAMAAVAWRLTRWMWKKGAGSSFAAGALGMLGIAFGSCMPVMCMANDGKPGPVREEIGAAFRRGFDRARGLDAIDGSRALMGALAEVIEDQPKALAPAPDGPNDERKGFPFLGGSSAAPRTDAERFDECIEKLFRAGTNSIRNAKISTLVRDHSVDRAHAEDIVHDAALELCLRHARVGSEPYEKLAVVFRKKVDSRLKNSYRRQDVRDRCAVVVSGLYYEPMPLTAYEQAAYERALCTLDEEDRQILMLHVEGHDSAAIGISLGLSAEAVRKRKSRAIKKLTPLLQAR
jgi:DNA-directed RNA polymerase specialized sigma24 family protein